MCHFFSKLQLGSTALLLSSRLLAQLSGLVHKGRCAVAWEWARGLVPLTATCLQFVDQHIQAFSLGQSC